MYFPLPPGNYTGKKTLKKKSPNFVYKIRAGKKLSGKVNSIYALEREETVNKLDVQARDIILPDAFAAND